MDVRQYAFLALQPSVAVKTRESFLGMPKRGLAFLLANVMFWQPVWAQADGIVVANPNTSLDRAGNGVPIINIATPNASGLSHNQFHDYNVGAQGLILNNGSTQNNLTQLGGHIIDNPNLKNSGSAQAILNEVISGNPSQLRGYTEVAGQSARVIVANPYGITCNGCGFINSPRVTLTTGKPVLDNGRLDRFQVDQGTVAIEGAGLNATNVDRFEIITRSAKINAEIQAQNLTIVAGRNDVNAQTLNATARADDGSSKPQLAIDSSALGGMYAGAIKLVGTEAGVGVKLDGKLIASGGDIQLDANGQLSLVDTSATGAVNVKAASLDARGPVYAGTSLNVQTQGNLTNRQTLAARDSINLSAGGQLTNAGAIDAGVNADGSRNANGDLSITAQNLDNTGKSLTASRNLMVNTAQTLNNQGGSLSAQTIVLTGGTLNNRDGQVLGDLGLNIDLGGALDNRAGVLGSGQSLTLKAASLDNREAGVLVSDAGMTVRVSGLLDNRSKGEISAKGAIDAQTGSLDNLDGKVIGKSTLALRSDVVDNRAGVIQADQQLTLNVGQMDNRDKGLVSAKAGIVYTGTRLDNSGGLISAAGPANFKADEVQNAAGRISSQGDLTATIGLLQQQGGALVAQGNLSLTGKTLDNRNAGLVGSTKALTLKVDEIDNRSGEISANLLLTIKGQRLVNSDGGKILAGSDLGLTVARLINQSLGLINAKGAATLTGNTLDNSGGQFNSLNGLLISLDDALLNAQGFISSEGALTLKAGRVDNSTGSLSSAGNLQISSAAALLNRAGAISTDSALTVNSASLDNSQKGLLTSKDTSRVDTGAFDNSQGGKLTSGASLTLKAGQVNNAAGQIASQQALDVSVSGLDQQGGELFSKASLILDLNHGQLNNQKGLINTPGTLLLKNLKGVNNQGGEISSQQAYALAAQDLDNSNGKLLSQQGLTLRIAQALNNLKGVISGASLDSHSDSLHNHDGLLSSRGALLLSTDKTLDNQLGTVIADGQLTLTADELDNRGGNIAGKMDAGIKAKNFNNQQGQLIATGELELEADQLDNTQNGLLGATQAMTLTVGELDNRGGEISTHSDLQVSGKQFDNSDGGKIFTGNALTLTVEQLLNRNKGLIDAGTLLTVQGQSLVNSGGDLISQQDTRLTLDGAFDNTGGKVSSEGLLTVKTAQLNNGQGSLSSAADLTVDSDGSVDNQGGKVVTDGALILTSKSLDNRQQGTLSGKGAVTVTTGAFDNSNGRLGSADTLNLVAGQVTNAGDGSIGSQGALTASVTGLDQQGGKLFSNTRLSLDLNHGQLNNLGGLINTPGALLLKQLNGVNNQGGTISSGEAFTLAAQSLDNGHGKVLSTQGLTLRIAAALDNIKGLIGAASLDARSASLNNSGGSLVSRGDLELTVDGLLRNDADGLISAEQTLQIASGELNNRDGGLINAKGNLTLSATGLDSSNAGEVSANGDIDLTLTALTQNGGRLLGDKSITLDLANGDLDNQNGLLTGKGPLTFKRLRDLNNLRGEISSNLGFNIIARAVNNSAGKIISGEKLLVTGTSLINQKGLISGWQGLMVTGDSLDNRASGTLSSKYADVSVDLKDALLNSGAGAVVAQGNLNINAGRLDNSDKGNLSSGAGQTLTLSGALDNNQGGLIASGAALDIVSTAFTNAGGVINAQQAINVTASRLDNSGGQLAGNDAITLNLSGELNNNAGKLAGAGTVLIKGVTDLRNQSGQLASQNTLDVRTGSLDNSNKGTIAAKDDLQITAIGEVRNNADGLIYSQNAGLQLSAGRVNNGKGSIQSEKVLTLEVRGDLDNQSGKILAQNADVMIKAANIDNRGGILSSIKGALEARTVGVLRNGVDLNNGTQGGIIQAQGLTLSALAGLFNSGGRISAQANDANITTAALDNHNGVLYAKGLVGVDGTSLDNTGGQIAGHRVDLDVSGVLSNRGGIAESETLLTVKAGSVDNQNGRLRSLGTSGKTEFQIGGLFDNRNGLLETANTDLTVAVGSFLNANGQLNHVGRGKFDISTANVIAAGGNIVTGGLLELNADSWSNSSVIQAGRLNVNVGQFSQMASGQLLASDHLQARGGNWINEGLIASDGVIDMQLGGSYSGNGRMSSVVGINLAAAQLTLNAASSIASGGIGQIKIGGLLSNAGRLTANGDMTVEAGSLNNTGTLGGSQSVTIKTANLLNDRGLIFSGQNTNLEVTGLTNNYGDFYSLGDLAIKGYNGAERANVVENISATMESVGNMSINAATLNNRGDKFEVSRKLVSGFIATKCIDCSGDTYTVEYGLKEIYEGSVSDQSPGAKLTSGGNFTFNGGDFLNSRSEVVAARDITINATNFSNIGASAGTIERTRIFSASGYTDGTHTRFMLGDVWEYNQRNDNGPLVFHYMDDSGQFRTGKHANETYWLKGSEEVRDILVDAETGRKLMSYGAWQHPVKGQHSEYDPNNLLSMPAQLGSYKLESDTEISRDGGAVQNAVVQAGGNVNITATQNLTNSVIHQDYGFSAGIDRVQNTQGGGTGKPLLVHLNSQLPPDLSQQQVNPLSLPGFSLPTGENGLFRLSGHGASSGSPGSGAIPSPTWTVGNQAVLEQEHLVAGSVAGPRDLHVEGPTFVSTSERSVDPVRRTPTRTDGVASNLDVSVNTIKAGLDTELRLNDLKASGDSRPVTRVAGLPDTKAPDNSHKYLIETNPVLTDLKQFMSSDYLLGKLGYDPDTSAKRLGDGLYEQRLVQQAVVARTGQRYIDGQTSDEGLFKYLMNNAIASKDQLNLSVGVTLTAEQVAALTHDIVWLEEHEVNGEKVLVPVLYLAQANNRLAPNGALIQGTNVKLIAGDDLQNAGTLRASNNLTAAAGNDLVNSGLIEAGNRLDLLAGNSIVNKSGGIITGRDVNLVAVKGDIINERTVTSSGFASQGYSQHREYLDNASRIEATNDLKASAGRDFISTGSALVSGRDTVIEAGRDASIVSAQSNNSAFTGATTTTSSVHQVGSTATAGRDFTVNAGRDLSVIGSQISAQRDIGMSADRDLLIASAEEESHSYSKSKKVTAQEDHIDQIASSISAGGKAGFTSGKDLTVVSSRITAGDEAYLFAGNDINVLAAEDYDYSLYDKKKKGSLGRKETRRDEVTKVTHIGSEISSGGDLTIASGGDQLYQAANLKAGKDLTISSGGDLIFESVTDLKKESHEKSKSSLAWTSAQGAGQTDETIRQSHLLAAGDIVIKAAGDIRIDVKEVTQKTVTDSIDAMVKADPQLAWLKDMQNRGDIDWRMIKEVHDQWDYKSSGMGMGAAIAVAIIVTVLTAGAASAAVGGTLASGTGSTFAAATATTAAGVGNVALTAVITTMASTAAVSAINNKGNLADTLKDVLSEENIKSYVTAAIIAGAGSYTNTWGKVAGPQGNLITQNVTERLKAYAVNTALKGLLTGDGSDKSWLTIAGTGALAEIYAYWTGRGPDIRPGEDRAGGPKFTELDNGLVPREWINGEWVEGKNIGLNQECASLLAVCHGTLISNIANSVPGMNAFATLHDTWMDKLIIAKNGVDMTWYENVGSMPPALVVNYGALYDQYRPLIEQTKREARQ
ncbi:two-partner secretion domain-containing protein [Pseudomonas protegens]